MPEALESLAHHLCVILFIVDDQNVGFGDLCVRHGARG
jgi:hypothetical protein